MYAHFKKTFARYEVLIVQNWLLKFKMPPTGLGDAYRILLCLWYNVIGIHFSSYVAINEFKANDFFNKYEINCDWTIVALVGNQEAWRIGI